MVVVATLIDKMPNLAGIARTCEVCLCLCEREFVHSTYTGCVCIHFAHTQTYIQTYIHAYIHARTHTFSLSLSLSLSHTHTHVVHAQVFQAAAMVVSDRKKMMNDATFKKVAHIHTCLHSMRIS